MTRIEKLPLSWFEPTQAQPLRLHLSSGHGVRVHGSVLLLDGLAGWFELGQEEVWALQLHGGRDAPREPVLHSLGAAVFVVAKQLRDLGGSAQVFDERPVLLK
jgi:hypothetical protein